VKLLRGNNGLLIIDGAVLCETAYISVVEDAWNDGLADHSAAFEVDQAWSLQLRHINPLQNLQNFNAVVCLSKARILITQSKVFIAQGCVNGVGDENMLEDEHVLFYRLIWIHKSKFSFNFSLCARDSRIQEVLYTLS